MKVYKKQKYLSRNIRVNTQSMTLCVSRELNVFLLFNEISQTFSRLTTINVLLHREHH